jgi:hypothetical protein
VLSLIVGLVPLLMLHIRFYRLNKTTKQDSRNTAKTVIGHHQNIRLDTTAATPALVTIILKWSWLTYLSIMSNGEYL